MPEATVPVVQEIPYMVLISGVVLVGLWLSNILYDLKVPHYLSRKVAHIAGGAGFLLFVLLFKEPWWPIVVSGLFVLLMGGARLFKPLTFRGTGGGGRFSELWYPISGLLVFAVGWAWLNQPMLSILCFLSMAWGDSATSIVRYKVYGKPVKGFWGSVAMFFTCLIIAWCFVQPIELGIIIAIGATIAEYLCGDVSRVRWLRKIDDNLAIPIISLIILFGGLYALGQL